MQHSFLSYISVIRRQLFIISILIALRLLIVFGVLPNEHVLINDLWKLFATYGLIAVAISSVIENLVGVNYYFPGAVVILTAMALTAGNIPRAIATFFTILIASSVAHVINFAIGRSFRKPNEVITLNKFRPYLISYWHPYFAAVTSFNAGTQNISFQTFFKYFAPAQIGWNLFWGVVMFSVGSIGGQQNLFFLMYLFYGYLVIWTIQDLYKHYKIKSVN